MLILVFRHLPFFSSGRNLTLFLIGTAPSLPLRFLYASCLFRRMVHFDCDIRRLYSEKQTHHGRSSHAISRKTSLPATRGIDCKRQIAFARKKVPVFFVFLGIVVT